MNTNGDGSAYVKYSNKNVLIGSGDADKITVAPNSVTLAADLLMTSNDINSQGGQVSGRNYFFLHLKQNQHAHMTASTLLSGTTGLFGGAVDVRDRLMMRAGSVLRLGLYSPNGVSNAFRSGALTASIMVDGVNQSLSLICIPTGSQFLSSLTSKDTVTFSASQLLGVSITASADYGSEALLGTSASWIATVLIEQ